MSEPVYVVRLTEGQLGYTEALFDEAIPSQWRAGFISSGIAEEIRSILESARPEHPERQAALEKLAQAAIKYQRVRQEIFEKSATDERYRLPPDKMPVDATRHLLKRLEADIKFIDAVDRLVSLEQKP